ncbi:unnamed protein product [Amoebophrya sp. A25]|nr:unnamed protein product [Amoebophrya sp. A25]|eukprot:GSA25T00024163001.1
MKSNTSSRSTATGVHLSPSTTMSASAAGTSTSTMSASAAGTSTSSSPSTTMSASATGTTTMSASAAGTSSSTSSPLPQTSYAKTGITSSELAKHNTKDDLWLSISGEVYDLTKFAKLHPGGRVTLLPFAGKDATEKFYELHASEILNKYHTKLWVGTLVKEQRRSPSTSAAQEESSTAAVTSTTSTTASSSSFLESANSFPPLSSVPYAEIHAFREGWAQSPWMDESHASAYADLRNFCFGQLRPLGEADERSGAYPSLELYQQMGRSGLLAARIGTACMETVAPLVKSGRIRLPGGVEPEKFDAFHEMLAHMVVGQIGYPGFADGLGGGFCIGLPPVLHFAQPNVIDKVVPACLLGDKRICLAISEPTAGSDVAAIETTARKSECGKFYIVNGIKKWITNGMFADYFVTAVRTGKQGVRGISLLLIERVKDPAKDLGAPASSGVVETRQITTSYAKCAGTAMVHFEDVYVPVENLLGEENKGFKCIMANFNHERWYICCSVQGAMRGLLTECFKWATQRKVFGKRLIEEPVIRQKLGKMTAAVEANGASLEALTYQMRELDYFSQAVKLAGPISLLKYNSTRTMTLLADEGCQIFGGRALTKGGMGRFMEGFQTAYKFASILGGSEEIMADLAIRIATREWPKEARL